MKYAKPMNVRLPKEEHRRLKLYAESQGLNLSEVVRSLIQRLIKIPKEKDG